MGGLLEGGPGSVPGRAARRNPPGGPGLLSGDAREPWRRRPRAGRRAGPSRRAPRRTSPAHVDRPRARPCSVGAAPTGRSCSPRGSCSRAPSRCSPPGTLYTDAVTLAGLHRELRDAPPADRAVVVRTQILPERLADADAAVVPELQRVHRRRRGGDIARVLRRRPYADAAADPATVDEPARCSPRYEGIEEHATLVDGAWPAPGATPVEARCRTAAAAALGRRPPATPLAPRARGSRLAGPSTSAISGTWAARPRRPVVAGATRSPSRGREAGGSFTTRGPLVVAAEDLVTGPLAEPLDAQWRAVPRVEGFTPGDGGRGRGARRRASRDRVNAALPFSNQAQVLTQAAGDPRRASTGRCSSPRPGILLLLVQFGVLAGVRGDPRGGAAPRAAPDRDRPAAGPRRRVRAPRVDGPRRGAAGHRARP